MKYLSRLDDLVYSHLRNIPKPHEFRIKEWVSNYNRCGSEYKVYIFSSFLQMIVRSGKWKLLKFLHKTRVSLMPALWEACKGHPKLMVKLLDLIINPSYELCMEIACEGHPRCVSILFNRKGDAIIDETCMEIASSGHPMCMKILRWHRCPINRDAMYYAANGYPNCMILLHRWRAPTYSSHTYSNIPDKYVRCNKLLREWRLI